MEKIEAIDITNVKDLESSFTKMVALFKEKESEHNWEARHKSIIYLRGILRGNGPEKYHDAIVSSMRQMVDGIIKSTESLRTTFTIDAIHLIADIGTYLPKSLDNYMNEQFLNGLLRATGFNKKIVASTAKDAMIQFLQHANYYSKTPHLLSLSMNEKNIQVRHYVIFYVKALLHAHGPKEPVRHLMDRSGGTELIGKIIEKGLNDAAPIVREQCREPFWYFWNFWPDRGDQILRQLTPALLKPLEKSKQSSLLALEQPPPSISTLNRALSPSPSNGSLKLTPSKSKSRLISTSSIHSNITNNTNTNANINVQQQQQQQQRSMSPSTMNLNNNHMNSLQQRSMSPTLSRHLSPTASPPPPISNLRKSRVPGLTRKKSTLSMRRKQSLLVMLQQDDLTMRVEGIQTLARKLSIYDQQPSSATSNEVNTMIDEDGGDHHQSYPLDVNMIQIDISGGTGQEATLVDGATLQSVMLTLMSQQSANIKLYEALSTWDCVIGVLLKLIPFEDYIPKLMLESAIEPTPNANEEEWMKYKCANRSWYRAKWYLKRFDPQLADKIYHGLSTMDGIVNTTTQQAASSFLNPLRKKTTLKAVERRKLIKQWLLWMDELVVCVIGLNNEEEEEENEWLSEENDDPTLIRNGLNSAYWKSHLSTTSSSLSSSANHNNVASAWFESDANIRQCLNLLLPLVLTSAPGSLWHDPLITVIGHLRLVNQKLFDILIATFDDSSATKISRILGIHLRPVLPSMTTTLSSTTNSNTLTEQVLEIDDDTSAMVLNRELDEQQQQPILANEKEELDESEIDIDHKHQTEKIEEKEKEKEEDEEEEVEVEVETIHHIEDDIKEELVPNSMATFIDDVDTNLVHNDYPKDDIINLTSSSITMITNNGNITPSSLSPTLPASTLPDTDSIIPDQKQEQPITLTTTIPPTSQNEPSSLTNITTSLPENLNLIPSTNIEKPLSKAESENNDVLDERLNTPSTPAPVSNIIEKEIEKNAPLPSSTSSTATTMASKFEVEQMHVPYFSPKTIDQSKVLKVFEKNERSEAKGGNKDKTSLLYQYMDKLNQSPASLSSTSSLTSFYAPTFRKLMRLCKETPIQKKWDQGGNEEEPGNEVWASANKDGGNFVELIQILLNQFLNMKQQLNGDNDDHISILLLALDLVKQLALTQTGLLRFYEMKLDSLGRSLESRLIEYLLEKRSHPDPMVCTSAEDTMEAVLLGLEAQTTFDIFLAYLTHQLIVNAASVVKKETEVHQHGEGRPIMITMEDMAATNDQIKYYHPIGSAFLFLGQSVNKVNNTLFIEEWLTKGGVAVFIKGLNHQHIQIRKSCVEAIVEFQEILGDDLYLFLGDLRVDQLNLIRHYVNKSIKKKASLRQLCANGQLR
ncbi:clasp N terminal-domain-containing protein [Cunninghamella echinulata]|nr:clasp N terminal-domain-containing protein [Cunninghamella echinulata]